MHQATESEKQFIQAHIDDDVRQLALKSSLAQGMNWSWVLQQIAARQQLRRKIPSWYSIDGLQFGASLALEQCSSEQTARYKHALLDGSHPVLTPQGHPVRRLADLTGGLGVDCAFMSEGRTAVLYVEAQDELAALATHNFDCLGLTAIVAKRGQAEDILAAHKGRPEWDVVFLDPARRSRSGSKVFALEDCTPDVRTMMPQLFGFAHAVLLKLSPMLDVTHALRALPQTGAVHIVSVDGECKELLLELNPNQSFRPEEVPIHCVDLSSQGDLQTLTCTRLYEQQHAPQWATAPSTYMYEPNASCLKAGAFALLSERFSIQKLHVNSHLFTADQPVRNFPGRSFKVVDVQPYHLKSLRKAWPTLKQANLATRNFPLSVAEIRKQLRLAEGGTQYLFATTLSDGSKVLVLCEKLT